MSSFNVWLLGSVIWVTHVIWMWCYNRCSVWIYSLLTFCTAMRSIKLHWRLPVFWGKCNSRAKSVCIHMLCEVNFLNNFMGGSSCHLQTAVYGKTIIGRESPIGTCVWHMMQYCNNVVFLIQDKELSNLLYLFFGTPVLFTLYWWFAHMSFTWLHLSYLSCDFAPVRSHHAA